MTQERSPRIGIKDIDVDYLFHGTSTLGLACILADDCIVAVDDDEEYVGVSTTTDFRRAAGYAAESERQRREDLKGIYGLQIPARAELTAGAVLVLDARRILENFEVRAVSWQDSDPAEERVIGNIAGLRKYVVGVVAQKAQAELWAGLMDAATRKPDESFSNSWAKDEASRMLSALQAAQWNEIDPERLHIERNGFGPG